LGKSYKNDTEMDLSSSWLLLNGSIVLVIGLILGAPYGKAINQSKPDHIINAWRVAHSSLSLGGATLIAIAAALAQLSAEKLIKWGIVVCFSLSGYSFSVALPIAAMVGYRGLSWKAPHANRIVYIGNSAGAWSSLAGAILLVYAVAVSIVNF
jgi:hypothetical protein